MPRKASDRSASGHAEGQDNPRAEANEAPTTSLPAPQNWPDSLLDGGGEMGARIRAYDWAATPLGPLEDWPQSLRTTVGTIVVMPSPMAVLWGADLIMVYNDAYRPLAGAKHPQVLGAPLRVIWSEVWDEISAITSSIMTTGATVSLEDAPYTLERLGFPEETYFNLAFCAIRDETGGIGGIFVPLTETTSRVLAERRIATLSALAAEHAATTVAQACDRALAALATNASDVPFALLYLLDDAGTTARLAGSVGLEGANVEAGSTICPAAVDLTPQPPFPRGEGETSDETGDATVGWPLAEALRTGEAVEVENLEARFGVGALPGGPWPEAARTALVLPLAAPTQDRPAGFLVVGASPRLPLDDAYRQFFTLAAGQIAAAIANAEAHEAERARVEALAELDRAKTAFFANVSHEFRTPLTLTLGPLEDALADESAPLPKPQRERLEIARRNTLRQLKLVNTLLDFSRIEAGRARAVFQLTDLPAYTAELASVFRSAVEAAGVRLRVDCPPLREGVGPVYVDREMWEQIVLNLLSNAFKFTFTGEIAVTLHHLPSHRGKGGDGTIALVVRDTGVGIAPEDLPHIFERFHRVEGMHARTHEGAGIGLALVRDLVRLHGGDIQAMSQLGVGTRLTVTIPTGSAHLPANSVQSAQASDVPAAPSPAAAPFVEEALAWLPDTDTASHATVANADGGSPPGDHTTATILLVEDNADMRAYVRRLLEQSGWRVSAVGDGLAAMETATRLEPDLVLADVMMPGLDGFGLVRALRADPQTATVPVLLLSARAGEEATAEGLAAGADDYLIKPFSARELVVRVRAHLELSRLRREAAERERQRERERAEANARELTLIETNRRMEDFLTRVSHELRTPLTGVKANVQLMVRQYAAATAAPEGEHTDQHRAQLLRSTERQIGRVERLMNDLVDLSVLQSGQFTFLPEMFDLAALVRETVAAQRRTSRGRTIDIDLDLPGGAAENHRVIVRADADRVAQVLVNYLTNALSYSDADQPVTVSLRADDQWARVAVRDEGPGVPSEDHQRVWERFQRVEGQHHRSGSRVGLGLGLYISKAIIEQHGGAIGVESVPGEGSTFWFTLPLAASADDQA